MRIIPIKIILNYGDIFSSTLAYQLRECFAVYAIKRIIALDFGVTTKRYRRVAINLFILHLCLRLMVYANTLSSFWHIYKYILLIE